MSTGKRGVAALSSDRALGAQEGARKHARARARALLFGSAVLFGLSAVLARLATLRGMNGAQVTVVRFVLGVALVAGLFAARPGTFRPQRKGLLVTRGLFGGFAALLFFLAIERIPAGEATLINNTFPIWGVILSIFALGRGPGAGLGDGRWRGGDRHPRAARHRQRTHHLLRVLGGSTRRLSIPFALADWPAAPAAWIAASGVGFFAFGAQLFMTEAYGALSVTEAALWQQLTPMASYLWALTLGERIGWATFAGVLLGVAGIVYGSVLGHRPRDAASREAGLAEGIPAEEP
jgi:drug/metabolite transporter (DMT)-like permease